MPKKAIVNKKSQKTVAKAKVTEGSPRAVLRAKISGKDYAIVARRGSYRAANNPRSRVQTPYGGSGDQQADPWSRRIVRELSRDMDRNSDTYRTLMDDWVRAVVGDGVRALLRSSDEEWNKSTTKLLDDISNMTKGGLDSRQMRSWYQLQGDYVRAVGADGDAAILKLDSGLVQMIESEQVTSGTTGMTGPKFKSGTGSQISYTDGINLDQSGAPQSFTIFSYNPQTGAIDYGTGQDFSPEYVEFTAIKSRFSQTRGLPLLVAGLEDWERIDSYKESEVIAAEQGSLVYGALEYPAGNMGFGGVYSPGQSQTGNDANPPTAGFSGGFSPNAVGQIDWHEASAGYLMELPNGVKYVPVNPQRPNKDAAPFLIEMIRQFCANAGLPYEIVFNDLRGLSWSVHRAMVALARDKISVWQKNQFAHVFRSVFKWILARLIANGTIEEVEGWDNFDLSWPQISWPDEGKEFEAQQLGLRNGLTTRHKIFGPDWRNMLDERMIELEYASEKVMEYNAMYPDFETTPAEFLGLVDHVTEKINGGDELKDDKTSDSSNVKKKAEK